jgi:hypothetical protein
MINRNIKILLGFFFLLLLWRCKQRYDSPYLPPVKGYLVVEGFIAGNAPTQFVLSRVIHLPGDSAIPAVTNAKVQVEGTDNSIYPLTETGAGVYTANTLPLNPSTRYRLRISTADGQTYLSDTVAYKVSPPIDSINWAQGSDGVTIYANTHDPANATRYYQWSYAETWEYTSAEFSSYKFVPNSRSNGKDSVLLRADSEYIYTCWNGDSSTSLLLGSSTKLAQDVIYRQKLQFIPRASVQLSVLYSIIVRQYALSQDAYNFLSLMKSNTESLGSIFDAQPSQLVGNIHNLARSDDPVIGWVSAGTVQQQRIYINRSNLDNWGYSFECGQKDTLVYDDPTSKYIDQFLQGGSGIPIERVYGPFGFLGWSSNFAGCVDCRAQGGQTKKPSFWPN